MNFKNIDMPSSKKSNIDFSFFVHTQFRAEL